MKITKKSFKEWAKKLDPDTVFKFNDIGGCVIATFLRGIGYRDACCGTKSFSYNWTLKTGFVSKPFPKWLQKVSDILGDSPNARHLTRADILKACK